MQAGAVAVIGAGTMGAGIAQVFAASGRQVILHDVAEGALRQARARVEAGLAKMVEKGRLEAAARDRALAGLRAVSDFEAVAGADFVVEAIIEDAAAKRELLTRLDALCRPETVLASNTSSISITLLAAATRRADRVIGMHFMNPVPLMTLVEVIRGLGTSDATTHMTLELCRGLGKNPVEVNDSPGFVSNRVLMPMINEAIFALMEGVATREAIDAVMKGGMNHPMGPLELADLIGLDVCLNILEVLHRELGDPRYRPCPLLRRMVAAGWLGRKSGRGFYTHRA
jgi:3-hydroxybutyryl-CoA dehydrogenase